MTEQQQLQKNVDLSPFPTFSLGCILLWSVSSAISPIVFEIPNSPPQICEGDALSVDNILILELDSLISGVTERKLPYSSALWCKTRFDNNFLINEIMYINVAYAVSGTW